MANKFTQRYSTAILAILSLLILGCGQSALSPQEYVRWVDSDNSGLVKYKELNGFKITSKLIPSEYIAIKETYAEHKEFNQETYNKKLKEVSGQYNIYIQLAPLSGNKSALRKDLASADDYYYRVEYFNFLSESDVHLIAGNDTLQCALSNFENNYEITPFNNWQLVFEKPTQPLKSDLKFVWDDQALGLGRIRFNYNIEDINNIPTITF
ncbi:MAG: hypothetical protein M0D57_08555 [Sphingobacteriales bacterium JAD_PAG50586_3]|nr:MAG: hypothetical protein M0D57_08555 [Sphingobacteriales bacterium JAD_PAG50586_3]